MKTLHHSTVCRIGQTLVEILRLDDLLEQTAHLIRQAFEDSVNVGVFLAQQDGLELRATATSSPSCFSAEDCHNVDFAILEQAAAGQPASICSAVTAHTGQSGSECNAPLISDHTVLGLINIRCAEPDAFSQETCIALERLAGFVSAAIKNIYLFDDLQLQLAGCRETKKALRAGEEMFQQVVASVSAHIYVTELSLNGALLKHYVSPNVETLTGYSRERFDSWEFWPNQVIYAPDRPLAARQFKELCGGHNSTVEYRMIRADDELIWVRDSGRVETRSNSRIIFGVVTNITERKQAEQALEQERRLLTRRVAERTSELSVANAKLARAARLKDEFLANMSHELRTPLNAILGMAEVLHSGIYGSLNSDQQRAARHIEESGRHLLALITDILDLSKIEAAKLELQFGPVHVDYVCEASLRMIQQIARKKRIAVTTDLDERVTCIEGDQLRIKQILVNLLSNAVKFTPEGGQIGLDVRGKPNLAQVQFVVWDTGIGIAPEKFDQLFKPFVQLDSRLSRRHEGAGLGLSLVAKLTELHGGAINVESKPGQGSRFIVTLPWRCKPLPSPTEEEQPISRPKPLLFPSSKNNNGHANPLVLLVEDNEANITTMTQFLQGMAYRVVVAKDGEEAVKRAAEDQPQIILMDIQMPGVDGLEATRRIRSNTTLQHLPIIALTALAMPGDRERCLEAGVTAYVSKPVSLKKLQKIMQSQLN